MKYRIVVIEIRHYPRIYTVEAESLEEAERLADMGDTIEEEGDDTFNLIDRSVIGEVAAYGAGALSLYAIGEDGTPETR